MTWRILQGDALDVLPFIDHADVVILDPPYSMQPNAVRGRDDGAAGASGAPVRLLSETLRHTRRILRPGGIAALVCDWRRMPDAAYLATLTGLRITTCVAWTRNRPGTGGLLRSAWDPILVLSAGSPEAVDRAAIPNTVCLDYPTKRVHPYEKPEGLWGHILQRVPRGGVVVDPFAGSATAGVDSLRHGMSYIGIEADGAFCDQARQRLAIEGPAAPEAPEGGAK